MTTDRTRRRRALDAMRNLVATHGWHEESLLVDHAAEVLGGDDAARSLAQAVFDKHYKIMGAN